VALQSRFHAALLLRLTLVTEKSAKQLVRRTLERLDDRDRLVLHPVNSTVLRR
jgi:hypothetical protein